MSLLDIKIEELDSKGNQLILRNYNTREILFKSYGYNIVYIKDGKVYIDKEYWDYSKTIGKYRNIFLKEDKKITQQKINRKEYKLKNLNKED